MKRIIGFLLLFPLFMFAQVPEQVPLDTYDGNWTSYIGYDLSGLTISKGINYFNTMGRPLQQQSWDVLTDRVWNSEVRYDYLNRPAIETLSAPIYDGQFGYKSDFMLMDANGSPSLIGISDYDSNTTLYDPPIIFPSQNSSHPDLGWYYSDLNVFDKYQDQTVYPYLRKIYSVLNPGAILKVLGGKKVHTKRGKEWLQSYVFHMAIENPDDPENPFYTNLKDKKIIKSVSRDVNEVDTVVFSDTDGNVVGSCRSGNEDDPNGNRPSFMVSSEILDKGYVDIHIPKGTTGDVTLVNFDSNYHLVRIFDLITEVEVPNYNSGENITLLPGFYRFEDQYSYYEKNNSVARPVNPIKLLYSINYYDLSTNIYDKADRLIKNIQPIGLQSTSQYNTLGQLVSITSADEGTSKFKYRKDGQIRFSQNAEQAKINAFSYTNYDELGRPIESGVYRGSLSFANSESIVDEIDGLPLDRFEKQITTYDVPDTELYRELEICALPAPDYKQTFLSGNVSSTATDKTFTTKTWYSYDVFGRVKWIIQKVMDIKYVKTLEYEYNPVNGQVEKVIYQKHGNDKFIHKYSYNRAGQLIYVNTSTDDITYTEQAHYIYNDSGALVRTELANNLQGIDYVYNLEGQLKAINHPSLETADDPGRDSDSGSTGIGHGTFLKDVFGMAIDYNDEDYQRNNPPTPITTSPSPSYPSVGANQYNGNIKATRWSTQFQSQYAYSYMYNKNNWLTDAQFGTSLPDATIIPNGSNDYAEQGITYDANGNIQSLYRNGYTDTNVSNSMDDLGYFYNGNRLKYIKDNSSNPDPNQYNDIKDQEVASPVGNLDNYIYNDLGQLTFNLKEVTGYRYYASGLVSQIFTSSSTPAAFITLQNLNYENTSGSDSEVNNWTQGQPMITSPRGLDETPCSDISGYTNNLGLEFLDTGITQTALRVLPNTYTKIDLDVLIDRFLYNTTTFDPSDPDASTILAQQQIDIHPKITIELKKADGTVINEITILPDFDSPEHIGHQIFCNHFHSQHINFNYTTTSDEEYLLLDIRRVNYDAPIDQLPMLKQRILVDNIKVQAATKTKMLFYYNDRGQRVKKSNFVTSTFTHDTYYVRDIAGNVMGVYTRDVDSSDAGGRDEIHTEEYSVYGIGRIGVFKRMDGGASSYTLYELTDHLGNVRAVIRKTPAGALALTNSADYYPFGMPLPFLQITDGNYRYMFQGQEKDRETNMEAFELRLWDNRIGRWLTVDPYGEFNSPYVGMGNNPVNLTDPDGGCTKCPKNANIGDSYSHSEHGDLAYSVDGAGAGFWSTADGNIILNDVVVSGGGSNIAAKIGRTTLDFVPFVGSGLDVYEGFRDGDGLQASLGIAFLIVDVATLGTGSLVKGAVKTIGKEIGEEVVEQSIKSLRRKAVRDAWKQEKNLIEMTGKGTRRWTAAEKKVILDKGKVKGYQGHHINNVKHHPELAGNPANIEFVTQAEHLVKHGGNFKNKTTGELINR